MALWSQRFVVLVHTDQAVQHSCIKKMSIRLQRQRNQSKGLAKQFSSSIFPSDEVPHFD